MDEFLLRAIAGGIGVALMAGPLGSFVVWRRMAYFGAALSHSALLGIALAFLLGVDARAGILAVCLLMALALLTLRQQRRLASDTLLGILAHGTLAAGLVVISFMETLRIDLMGYLFGDVLAVTMVDLKLIYGLALVVLVTLGLIWRPLLSLTVSPELARAEGVPALPVELVFVTLLAAAIAIGMQVVGILLVVSLLIIPAAAARQWAGTPELMAACAVLVGVVSVVAGIGGSWVWDVPSGPAIVVAASLLFAVSWLARNGMRPWRRTGRN